MRKGMSLIWGVCLATGLAFSLPAHAQGSPCPAPQAKKKIGLGGLLSAAQGLGLGGKTGRALGAAVNAAGAVGADSVNVGGTTNCGGSKNAPAQAANTGAPAPGPAGSGWAGSTIKGPRLADGDSFRYQYLVDFWRSHPPETTLSNNPNDTAPGAIMLKPSVFVHDATIPKSEVALIVSKLTIISDALLALPPLKDIHGADLRTSININRVLGPGGSHRVEASLAIGAYPIDLQDPKTFILNGRYYTPGEGRFLTVTYNGMLSDHIEDDLTPLGSYNGLQLLDFGGNYRGYIANTSRPVLSPPEPDKYGGSPHIRMNPDFFDRSASPSKLQLLTMKCNIGSTDVSFASGRHPPTTSVARVLAALYMADWNEIVRRMEEVR